MAPLEYILASLDELLDSFFVYAKSTSVIEKENAMKKMLIFTLTALMTTFAWSADLNGTKWKAIDDKTGQALNIIQFSKEKDGTYTGRVAEILQAQNMNGCVTCGGDLKGKKLQGFAFIKNLKYVSGNKYENGSVIDPASGRTYRLNVEIMPDAKKLKLRGYMLNPMLGGTQTWIRAE